MASLGANISIPDQVVLVGGTGRHLSDRFSHVAYKPDSYSDGFRYVTHSNAQKLGIQDRLGPRRFTGNDIQLPAEDLMYSMQPNRPHVLKRLGTAYNPWGNHYNSTNLHDDRDRYGSGDQYRNSGRVNYNSYNNSSYVGKNVSSPNRGSSGRGRRRGGWFASSYGGYRHNRFYNPYNYYNNYYSSYYNSYSRPRYSSYNKYYNNSSYSSYRNYGGYNRGYSGFSNSRYSRSRRGRYGNSTKPKITQEDLDRDLDEYRAGGVKQDHNGDVNMS